MWKNLDDIYLRRIRDIISSIQISEIYIPFRRAGDFEGLKKMKFEISKLKS